MQNEILLELLELRKFEYYKNPKIPDSLWKKAEKIVEDYELKDESKLSNTQLQMLARVSAFDPSIKGDKHLKRVIDFIEHQIEKTKPNSGYRISKNDKELGKVICEHIDKLKEINNSIYEFIRQNLSENSIDNIVITQDQKDTMLSNLLQEYLDHLVAYATILRKENQ